MLCSTRFSCASWLTRSLKSAEALLPLDVVLQTRSPFLISLSTVPARLPFLQPVLQQLVRQTQQADAIFLAIPKFSRREKRCYKVPNYLKSNPELRQIRVLRSDDDYGPATKLIPLLQILKVAGLRELEDAQILVLVGLTCLMMLPFCFIHMKVQHMHPLDAYRLLTDQTSDGWV